MDNFIVSARKYRPASFATVIGQPSITNTLKNAIRNNQIAQAFLFTGPRGVGKTTCARIMAKTINCTALTPEGEACNQCESCVSFNKSSSFNIYELDAASNNLVDDIRSLVEQVRIPPQTGKYKVYIIDEVHMLSTAAFNAFLKTLEEPPAYAKFILATTEKHKILPTILSRCQVFDFRRIGVEDIAHHLAWVAESEQVTADPDALHIIAQKADGGLRDALSMFDQLVSFAGNELTYSQVIENLNVLDYDYYFKVTSYILQGDVSQTLLLVNEVLDNGFDGQHFVTGLGEHFRNLLVSRDPETVNLLETSANIRNLYLQQSQSCHPAFLLKALTITNECDLNYKISNNKRLHLEIAMLQLCNLASPIQPPSNPAAAPVAAKMPEKPATAAQPPAQQPVQPPAQVRPQPPVEPQAKAEPTPVIPIQQPVPVPEPQPANRAAEPETTYQKPAEEEKKPAEKKSSFTGINVGDLMKTGGAAKAEESSEPAGVAGEKLPPDREAFSQARLEAAWKTVAASFEEESPSLSNTMAFRIPQVNDDYRVQVAVGNKIQEGELVANRPGILERLRKELKNWGITLEVTVEEQTITVKMPYSGKEKFQRLAEENPDIILLKNQLNLDIEI